MAQAPKPATNHRARLFSGLRILLALLVVTAVTVAVAKNWREVSADIGRIDAGRSSSPPCSSACPRS